MTKQTTLYNLVDSQNVHIGILETELGQEDVLEYALFYKAHYTFIRDGNIPKDMDDRTILALVRNVYGAEGFVAYLKAQAYGMADDTKFRILDLNITV